MSRGSWCTFRIMNYQDAVDIGPRPRATMKDVAALAGVGVKTVSRVVNNESGVSQPLMDKVHRAVKQLDFLPNITASNLRRTDGKTRTIGLLVHDVANPFSSALYRAVEDVARARGVIVVGGSVDEDPQREQQLAWSFVARRVDGLILVPTGNDQSYLNTERRAGTPIVFVDRAASVLDADAVRSAHTDGARGAIEHLIAHGHHRIGYLGHPTMISTAVERYAGYRDALNAAGIPVDPAIVRHELSTSDQAAAALNELMALSDPPTAFFASQVFVTIGSVKALRQAKRHDDIALVGFDDIQLADALGVTLVHQNVKGIGALAADVLFRRLDGDDSPVRHHIIPTQLVPRGSGEIPGPFAS
jgi:LacI family transcriptional regulator